MKFHNAEQKIEQTTKLKKKKVTVEFNYQESTLIKLFAVQKSDQVKLTTRFLSGKILMFAMLSLTSFIYGILETFCFPDEKGQKYSLSHAY